MVIFPADGSETMSQDLIQFFLAGYGQTAAEIRDNDLTLLELTTEVRGVVAGFR